MQNEELLLKQMVRKLPMGFKWLSYKRHHARIFFSIAKPAPDRFLCHLDSLFCKAGQVDPVSRNGASDMSAWSKRRATNR
jgi:hypothetical protein